VSLDVTMTGSGSIGHVAAAGWSILESCTPAMPGDSRGSMGTATVRAQVKSDSRFVMDNEALLESSAGSVRMRVSEVSVDGLEANLSLVGPAQFLNVDKTMPPVWFSDANDFLGFEYGSGTGQIATGYGIAVDPVDGGVLVASYGTVDGVDRSRIIKYDANGVYVTEFGSGVLSAVPTVAVSPVDQAVWVGLGVSNHIKKFVTADGGLTYTYSTQVGSAGSGNGQFGATGFSIAVAVDSAGNVYAGDRGNTRIQKFNSSAVYQAQVNVGGSASYSPFDLAFDPTGTTLYASTGVGSTVGLPEWPGQIKSYNTSLVLQSTLNFVAPAGTQRGIGCIGVDSEGIWAHWFNATYLVRYSTAGVELNRWQSLYPVAGDFNSNIAIANGSAGTFALYRYRIFQSSPYGGKHVTGFDFSPVLLSTAIEQYMEACDPTLNGWTLDYQGAVDPEVVFPGWSGNVWANLKELFATYALELVADHDTQTFIIRDIGSATTTITNFGAGGVTTHPVNLTGGRVVDVIYQQPRAGGGVVWDAATENVPVSIAAGARTTKILYTVNHPAELAQPVPTDTLPIQPGQYYVTYSTGTLVPAATWLAAGGNITLAVGESPGTISADIIGPSAAISGYTGPFSFATGNTATSTPALSIVGNGTFCTPRTFVRAGSQGQPFNSPFMDTIDRVCSRGHYPSRQDPGVTVSFTCPVSELPAMGQVGGTVFPYEQSKYRITDIRWGNLEATVTAERHVTAGDWETTWAGETAATYEAYWPDQDYSAGDEQVQPLRHA
jgi:hypothetical protein